MPTGEYTNLELGIDPREHPWLEEDRRTTSQTIGDAFQRGVHSIPFLKYIALDDAQHAGAEPDPRGRALAPRVSPDEIARQSADADVQIEIPAEGLSQPALDLLINRRRQDNIFESRAQRAASGLVPAVGSFVAGIGSQLLDPVTDAALLIPIPGLTEARIASVLGRTTSLAARAGIRFGAEAGRATLGLAAVEPAQSFFHKQLQDDYDFRDSIESIALGGLVFGGLRSVGGAVLDRFRSAARRGIPAPAPSGAELRAEAETTQTGLPQPRTRGLGPVVEGLPGARTLETPDIPRPPSLISEPLPGRSAADVIKRAESYRDLAADLARKPGFEHSSTDKLFLAGIARHGLLDLIRSDAELTHLTPELAKAIEIAAKPWFARTLDEKVFLEALQKGHEGEFINERLGKTIDRIEQLDKELTGRHYGDPVRIKERNDLLDDLHDAGVRMKEIGYEPLRTDHLLARVSDDTRKAVFHSIIAQAISDKEIRVMELLRLDPRAVGLPRANLAEVAEAGRVVRSPEGNIGAQEGAVASQVADERIKNGAAEDALTESIRAEAANERSLVEAYEKALGREGELKKELESDQFNAEADTLIKAAQFALGCNLG